ncbi:cadmium-translocating P-type ATPase [bacterium]|nr:cadmium-translocating P-type ATPase [bacterium]
MIQQIELKVFGMSCSGCAAGIERKLKSKKGFVQVQVDFGSKLAKLKFEENILNYDQILQSMQDLGYEVFPLDDQQTEKSPYAQKLVLGSLLFIPLFIIAMFLKEYSWSLYAQVILATLAFPYLGAPYFKSAWSALSSGILGMDVLVSLGSGSAFLYSWAGFLGYASSIYFDGSIAILYFLSIGKIIEERAKKNAFSSLEDLLLNNHKDLRQIIDGQIVMTAPKDLEVGMQILVPAGEVIPVDAVVTQGSSTVDESLLTGEAQPVFKEKDHKVYSGSKNLEQALHMEILHLAKHSTLSQIINEVKAAKLQKANLARIADKIAAVFVPIVLLLALVTAVYWYLQVGFTAALLNAISVLLIACPCALGLATPAAISVGLNTALQRGILIKNIKVIENISKVNHLVLDKTGTLTQGKPSLQSIEILGSLNEDQVLAIAYSMEKDVNHPFATAILDLCSKRKISMIDGIKVQGLVGKGLQATLQNDHYLLGSTSFLQEHGVITNFDSQYMGFTLVKNEIVVANFYFEDPLREGSDQLKQFFKDSKLQNTLLSGDLKEKVELMQKEFHFDQAHAQVSPKDKADLIKKLRQQGQYVAMIGDGMNDSSALAHASLGISFLEASELAKSSSDIILMKSDLRLIEDAFKISYAIKNKIIQNYFWAFLYNIIAIPLAMSGQLDPMVAAGVMALSSTSVVLNSLLLRGALK